MKKRVQHKVWGFSWLFCFGLFDCLCPRKLKVVGLWEPRDAGQKVSVYNTRLKEYLHTNTKGIVNIKLFKPNDTIIFSHPDYETVRYTNEKLSKTCFWWNYTALILCSTPW